ncbi:MAG: acetyltransferase [Clostridium sp.]|nr:acetyltransferase [Clostridium sp.]
MMKDIAIYGAGGFGREVACMIEKINSVSPEWNLVGFFDDCKGIGEEISHFGITLGGIDALNNWPSEISVALCMGSPHTMKIVREKIRNTKVSFPNLIDPNFSVADAPTFFIGQGNIIKGHCSATVDVEIGNFNAFNGFVNIGHDVKIGDYNVMMPGTRISGEVTIGNLNLFGADCFIKQQIRIGDGVTVSPLSALLTRPKDGMTYIGNPAKIFKF